jgi:hypothetical protein
MTTTAATNEVKQFKHIIFNSKNFEYMTITRKSLFKGIAYHDVIYVSRKDGYDVKVFNMKSDAGFEDSHGISGSSGDEDDPQKLYVTIENGCLRLEDNPTGGQGDTDLIDFIPLSEIHNIRFDAVQGADGSTYLNSIFNNRRTE